MIPIIIIMVSLIMIIFIIIITSLLLFTIISIFNIVITILVIHKQTCSQKLARITDSQYNIKLSGKDEVCSIENSTDKTKVWIENHYPLKSIAKIISTYHDTNGMNERDNEIEGVLCTVYGDR